MCAWQRADWSTFPFKIFYRKERLATEEAPVAVQALILLIRGNRNIPSRLLGLGSIVGATKLEVGDDLRKEGTLRSITPTLNQSVPQTMRDGSPLLRPIV
jgi:hypothetical protein